MDEALQYLIHYFNDQEHLFQTITMADPCQLDAICDQIAAQKGWYSVRYSRSDRGVYLARRQFVEKQLYDEYTQDYGMLKEKVPVYFYIYPNSTLPWVIARGQERARFHEAAPRVLVVKTQDIMDPTNITFTLNDSFLAYWKKAKEAGIKCREEGTPRNILEDHNKVFPFSLIETIHRKYAAQEVMYEVQVWDYELLKRIPYTILEDERA